MGVTSRVLRCVARQFSANEALAHPASLYILALPSAPSFFLLCLTLPIDELYTLFVQPILLSTAPSNTCQVIQATSTSPKQNNTQPPSWGESTFSLELESTATITNIMLTTSAVKKRCTSTWSLSATLTPESRPPPAVSLAPPNDAGLHQLTLDTDLIYKCGGIDKRTIEKFEKVWLPISLGWRIAPIKCTLERAAISGLSLGGAFFRWWGCANFSTTSASPFRAFANSTP
jgi:hypothetical protein